tara:strand:- start:65 stop:403 length:339 start_codon:yes stop_codon:yes gene_type:complete
MDLIDYNDFEKIKICCGTILSADEKNDLKKPSILLTIDFGKKIGIKKSSAQLKSNYKCKDLINKQILAVVNFYPKQIGNTISEVLVLGLPDENNEPILVLPESQIVNGKRLY